MGLRKRVTARVVDLFSHSDMPVEDTARFAGDAGLFGPDSISWEVLGDVSSFVPENVANALKQKLAEKNT